MEKEARDLLVKGADGMGISLPDEAVSRFETYNSLLQLWGRKINLTARLGSREVVTHHFLDSLSGVAFVSVPPGARVIDIGCGAGLPAFPLKFALPGLRVALIDSVRKKIAFCQEVIRATGVFGMAAHWGRGEELGKLPEHRGAYDWAVSRALGQSSDVVKLALPFVAPGGRVLLYKGVPESDELQSLGKLCDQIGASWEIRKAIVPFLEEERSLIVVRTAL